VASAGIGPVGPGVASGVGDPEGPDVRLAVGLEVDSGAGVGPEVGPGTASGVGDPVGLDVGLAVGLEVGSGVGSTVGPSVGVAVGLCVSAQMWPS